MRKAKPAGGVTLAMQLERGDRDSRPMALRWLRRVAVLYAIGWAHAILFSTEAAFACDVR